MGEDDGQANMIDKEHCVEIKHLFAHHPREDGHLDFILSCYALLRWLSLISIQYQITLFVVSNNMVP